MTLICVDCANRNFFDVDVETVMEVASDGQSLIVDYAKTEDWAYSEEAIRDQVREAIISTLKMNANELNEDFHSGKCLNPYLRCASCFSETVCRPFSDWYPRQLTGSMDEELLNNRKLLQQLRAERRAGNENKLPIVWKP